MKIRIRFAKQSVQRYDWDCGVAAVAFLLRNKGRAVDYSKLMKSLGASARRGTDLVRIVDFFAKRPEFKAKPKGSRSFDNLKEELEKGKGLLVAYQNWDKPKDVGKPDWGHYGVIYEIDGDKVRLFDPGEENGLTEFTKEEFEKRWYEDDQGVHYGRWAMSVDLRSHKG